MTLDHRVKKMTDDSWDDYRYDDRKNQMSSKAWGFGERIGFFPSLLYQFQS